MTQQNSNETADDDEDEDGGEELVGGGDEDEEEIEIWENRGLITTYKDYSEIYSKPMSRQIQNINLNNMNVRNTNLPTSRTVNSKKIYGVGAVSGENNDENGQRKNSMSFNDVVDI